jgi:hypothetical protein
MTGSIGVIEWLDNTKPIRACLEEKPARKNQMVRLQEAYRSWVSSFKGETMGMLTLEFLRAGGILIDIWFNFGRLPCSATSS